MLKSSRFICGPVIGLSIACSLLCTAHTAGWADEEAGQGARCGLRVELPGQQQNVIKTSWPGIGCWFWTAPDFEGDGYRRFVDLHEKHSAYGVLTTSIRHQVEVTQPEVHDQLKRGAEYARAHGMEVVLDLDVRLARQAFMDKYPGEMQEIVRLRELALQPEGQTGLSIDGIETGGPLHAHATGCPAVRIACGPAAAGVFLRRRSARYRADTIEDITGRCQVTQADAQGVQRHHRRHWGGPGANCLSAGRLHAVHAGRVRAASGGVRAKHPPAVCRRAVGRGLQGRVGISGTFRPAARRPVLLPGDGRRVYDGGGRAGIWCATCC